MNNILEKYYRKIIKYDFINKFYYVNVNEIPSIKKIILNFGCKNIEIKNISGCLLSLELITKKKGTLTRAKRSNILLKIRKGQPSGCVVVLKKKEMYDFFFKLLIDIFPNLKEFKHFKINKNLKTSFSFTLKHLINFRELERQFYLFMNLPPLNIIIITTSKTGQELFYLLNALKFPFLLNK